MHYFYTGVDLTNVDRSSNEQPFSEHPYAICMEKQTKNYRVLFT